MKRTLLLFILICCHLLPVTAQKNAPKWMDKSKKAVVLITTYGKDGAKLTSGTGFLFLKRVISLPLTICLKARKKQPQPIRKAKHIR